MFLKSGVHKSYGYIDDQGGKTFDKTLELAWQSNSELIQVADPT
jgi:hypothetical protein